MKFVFALTSSESKRLIARGVMQLPQIKEALLHHKIILAAGTTNTFIAEEIMGKSVADRWRYCFGIISEGLPCTSPEDEREPLFVFVQGEKKDVGFREAVKDIQQKDVFIKGANAVDGKRHTGVLVNHASGGTMGFATPYLIASQAHVIIPVGLEKCIPSVEDAVSFAAPGEIDDGFGYKNWLAEIQVPQAVIITEIEAINILTGAQATLMAAGGVGGSEGAVILGAAGDSTQINSLKTLIAGIRGEPSVVGRRQTCSDCKSPCSAFHQ